MEVIDGQQRLATTTIFMCAARDYLRSIDESEAASSIENDYINQFDYSVDRKAARLTLNDIDNEFFKSFVIDGDRKVEAHKPSHTKIKKSYELARTKISSIVNSLPQNSHRQTLFRWITFISDQAIVVIFQADNGANAYKMFETLNDRGLSTTQADLVKNHIFSVAGDNIGRCQSIWGNIKGTLETLDEKNDLTIDFLKLALTCKYGKGIKRDDIYERTEQSITNPDSAFKYLAFLDELSKTYVSLQNPESIQWKGYPNAFRESIVTLNLLDMAALQPLQLAIAQSMSKKEQICSFKFLVSMGVRLSIALSPRSGGTYDVVDSATKKIIDKEIRTLQSLKIELAKIIASDEEFRDKFSTYSSSTKVARYLLRTLERSKQNKSDPELVPNNDSQQLTLEHILPRNPPEGTYQSFSEAERKMFVNRLGNMTLLGSKDNSGIGNIDYAEKISTYSNSDLAITSELGNYQDWNSRNIISRQANFASIALKAWPI